MVFSSILLYRADAVIKCENTIENLVNFSWKKTYRTRFQRYFRKRRHEKLIIRTFLHFGKNWLLFKRYLFLFLFYHSEVCKFRGKLFFLYIYKLFNGYIRPFSVKTRSFSKKNSHFKYERKTAERKIHWWFNYDFMFRPTNRLQVSSVYGRGQE